MPKLTEMYEELQGRPNSRMAMDMESRKSSVVPSSQITPVYMAAIILTFEGEPLTANGSILYRS